MINNILRKNSWNIEAVYRGINLDLSEIKESVQFLWDTQLYKENFNELFLATSQSFCSGDGHCFLGVLGFILYHFYLPHHHLPDDNVQELAEEAGIFPLISDEMKPKNNAKNGSG
jgi:hypothetical protein